ncbi:Hypothetical predicted protein [Mytilus galloprovincialis]|uniref:Uncharacterized protein n=1 Tax=Mytilus galloprovincialis TaxID=29158 RepID=A0A8B6H4F8_MYTGA|nr:Hypothetical predicted protein [Mytilus galloprovincialis]
MHYKQSDGEKVYGHKMENIESAVTILIIICSVVNGRDFNTVESSFNVKRSDSTENIQATYNILIYNDHIPSQNYRPFRSRPMFPEQTLGSGGSTFDSNLRHSRIGQFVGHPDSNLKRSRIGQFDGQSDSYKEAHNIERRNHYPSFFSNVNSDHRYLVWKPAQMLFNLLKNYGSFSESDFSTVYKQWFGL